jgi:single-stranded-DNA-specific exonuclease
VWAVAPAAPAAFFAALPDLHPVAAQVLYNRGLRSVEQVRGFLASDAAALYDPRLLLGIDRAIARLRRALHEGETIAVHGDFDVDGVTAAAVLTEGLRAAGGRVVTHIPRRTTTGYGLHAAGVERLAADGATVIVTGDTGTRATEAVARAAALGVDVIITDHHVPGAELPGALALVNPQQAQCPYPFKDLSGSGVAWKLVDALARDGALRDFPAESLLDLVALGTIVDVSPLVGENRALVQRGLRRLAEAPRPGLRALLARAGAGQHRPAVDERTVAFALGPRLNAAGRMDDAALALELLLTADSLRAGELVRLLDEMNVERQQLTERVLVAARAQAERLAKEPVLVLRGEDWPPGVLGLVAARLADEYGRPAFVVEVGPAACRGSGRSVAGFDLVQVLTGCADLLVEYGGHALAAGFAVLPADLDALVERLVGAGAARLAGPPAPVVADCDLEEGALDWALYRAVAPLRPFGAGNPAPLLVTRGVRVLEARPVGAGGAHLRARLRVGNQVVTAFGPDLGPRAGSFAAGGRVDVLYSLDVSIWDGYETLELRLADVRPAVQQSGGSADAL